MAACVKNQHCWFLAAGVLAISITLAEAYEAAWPLGLEPDFVVPDDNALTAKSVELGRMLFFDTRLSRDGSLSCASCHDPRKAFTDRRVRAVGIGGQTGRRNTPTIVNRLLGRSQFWDGRAATLEDQAAGPLFSNEEMGLTRELLLLRLKQDALYPKLFQQAYGTPPSVDAALKALASFERTLLAADSPFDRYEWEGDRQALNPAALRGLRLFRGKARCSACHVGSNLTDELFHAVGAGQGPGYLDAGRMEVTGLLADFGKFKTPTLRNVALTAPYMHDGSLATLREVVEYYDQGAKAHPNLDPEILPLLLSEKEKDDLVEFLHSLTSAVESVAPQAVEEMNPWK